MTNVRDEVIAWLKAQHPWLQEAAHQLLTKKEVADADIEDLIGIMERAADPVPGHQREFPELSTGPADGGELRLASIGEIEDIDSLAPREPLGFGKGNLTVLYGRNGSGKSGYTRILKKACGKPPGEPLRRNVYQPPSAKQQCVIRYKVGAEEKSVTWGAKDAVQDLRQVDIFDATAGRLYLTGETTPTYVPPTVALFEGLVSLCARIAALVEARKRGIPSKLPALPPAFLGVAAGKMFSNLSADQTEADLSALLAWTDADGNGLAELEERLKTGDPAVVARTKRTRRAQFEALTVKLEKALAAVSGSQCASLKDQARAASVKRQAAHEGALALASSSRLDGIGGETWRSMWEAARAYSQDTAYPASKFPVVTADARCPLCHQDLEVEAKTRLGSFEEYVGGALASAAVEAESARDAAVAALPGRPDDAEIATAILACGLVEDRWVEALRSVWDAVGRQSDLCRNPGSSEAGGATWKGVSDFPVLAELAGHSAALEREAAQHDADAKAFDRQAASAGLLQLKCRKWTAQQAAAITAELARLKEVARLDNLKAMANSAPLSKKLGRVADVLITDEYVQRFKDELKALGAKNISVELVKKRIDRGKVLHELQLKSAHTGGGTRPVEVLSEGEIRIVSLAAFLADTTANSRNTPFIFDDPISSLDLDFEWAVAMRLAELAKTRQVVVFTHRLSLYGSMEDAAKKNGDAWKKEHLFKRCVERHGAATGVPVDQAFWNAKTKAANTILLTRLAKTKKEHWDPGDSAAYRQDAQAICSDFRKLLERTVEEDLLNEVVLRHRRSVTTDNRLDNLAKITLDDCKLFDSLMTTYSRFEHSQSQEVPVEVPDPAELLADLKKLQEWRDEFAARGA